MDILSSVFRVGGGFLITPLMFFTGISATSAVSNETNQIVALTFSVALAHFKRKTVHLKIGEVLLIRKLAGAALGGSVFIYLKSMGQADLLIKPCYALFLGIIGSLMFVESLRALRNGRSGDTPKYNRRQWGELHNLPFKMRFHTQWLYI